MSLGYGKSKIISVRNSVVDSAGATVDLVVGDVVAIDDSAVITVDGPQVIDGQALVAANAVAVFGVVTGKIPAGQAGPICISGECLAQVYGDASTTVSIGAFLAPVTTQEDGAGAGLAFIHTTLATVNAVGAVANGEGDEYITEVRGKLVDGTITAATPAVLPVTNPAAQVLCRVTVINNPMSY